jgi:pimeloyl-ACP methyl ester carboxylesterase
MIRRLLVAFAVFALVLALIPASLVAAAPPAYFVDEAKLPFAALPGTTTARYWGVHGGAGYRIEVPEHWNGELVLYAHGYRGTGLELTVSNPSIRDYLVQQGFAWAASSYRTNGYDVKQGVKDTHALGSLFNGLVGNQTRTYIMGHSMGGHITGVAIEQYRNAYAGALPMCGVMGDRTLFDYFLDFHLVAQALTGIQVTYPFPDNYQTAIAPQIRAALLANPAQLLQLKAVMKYRSGGDRPLYDDVAFASWFDFLLTLGGGDPTLGVAPGPVAGNVGTVYQLDGDPALSPAEQALNASVLRVATSPQGRQPNGLANIPPIAGDLPIPVVSLHTIGDLFVPFSMEQIYARRVAAGGKADLLVSRAIRDVSHCGFTVPEQERAFADLVAWVDQGIKPNGDAILDPTTVASPAFGCQFTLAPRPYAPPC